MVLWGFQYEFGKAAKLKVQIEKRRDFKNQRYMLVERLVGMLLREMFEIRAC